MFYIQQIAGRICSIFEEPNEAFLSTLSRPNAGALRAAFEKNIEGAVNVEALPDGFDWAHIDRYSLDENNRLIDNGWEEPPREQTTEELLLETAGDHEYRLCLLELGVNEDDL